MELVRIFLSSPGDVEVEREKVKKEVSSLDRTYGQTFGIHLECIDWKTHVTPAMGRAQAIINEQVGDYDIFLGIMWKRFGTPTGVADSGTREEFDLAYNNWLEFGRPRIIFYFSQAPFMPKTSDEIQQMGKVIDFKTELAQKGLFWEYPSAEQFQELIHEHLAKILLERFKPQKHMDLPADFSRYLDYLKKETMYADIRGLVTGTPEGHQFRIDKLYIPLKTSGLKTDRDDARRKTSEKELVPVEREVALQEALKYRQLLIKGDPGAGKTTFLRLMAFLLCSRRQGEVAGPISADFAWPEPTPLPILIRLSQLVDFIQQSENTSPDGPLAKDSPKWLCRYLEYRCLEYDWRLTKKDFQRELAAGHCLILLDGLDEAPDERTRTSVSALAQNLVQAYPECQIVITSRPAALIGKVLPAGFEPVEIAALDETAMQAFLEQWCAALYLEAPEKSRGHFQELSAALRARPEIRRMAQTPVMLTALAVVHWNENKLPEQRAELYKSIIGWLLSSRDQKPGRLNAKRCQKRLQQVALAMFLHPDGRQRQVGFTWAAEQIQAKFTATAEQTDREAAEQFLREEVMDSGVIVERNRRLEFWHLSFQEYLAAVEIGGLEDADRIHLLTTKNRLYDSEWRELMLLLAGVLYDQGEEKMNHLVNAIIDRDGNVPLPKELARLARTVGLLGAMLQDLSVFHFQPAHEKYPDLVKSVLGIFDPATFRAIPVQVRIEAADALARVGDPRLPLDLRSAGSNYWITIPAGTFRMGAQKQDKNGRHYDPDVWGDEGPPHPVELSAFAIGKYPVTVAQFQRFMDDGGYQQEQYWIHGGFGKFEKPDHWDEESQFPSRPVRYLSWYEAAAFAHWAGCRLPTEAEWERAARGPGEEYRKYPWGNRAPDVETVNYSGSKIGHPTPVGIFPENLSPEGAIDMAGNVWEWCKDWKSNDYYQECFKKGVVYNPTGPDKGEYRVVRGGSFNGLPFLLQCSIRSSFLPHLRYDDFGFRVVWRAQS